MRPDLDDFEEMNQDGPTEPRARAMSWLVLAVAVVGFAALAYYAYQSGTRSMNDGNLMVVNAEPGAVKEAPANPGGEDFPNKDKTIYNAIAPDSSQKVEKLLPDSEQPSPAAETQAAKPNNTTTYVANSVTNNDASPVDDNAAPKVAAEDAPPPEAMPPANAPKAAAPAPVATESAAPVKTAAGTPVQTAAPVAAPAAKPVTKPVVAASGSYKVQLGAFKSQAEAQANWKRIQGAHSSVLHGSPVIVRADLPNGTFYRLRAGGYASAADAKAACSKLSAAGQACFYVGK